MEAQTSTSLLNAVKARAIELWGEEDWFKELVKEYVRLENQQSGEAKPASYMNRRNQIQRALDTGGCRLDTALLLVAAVGHKLQMVKVVTEVIDF
ncbi:hypothetical protein [Leptolyngbya sp. BL0902]|uniref:hypothetical protein n=1 Tax=Leptolyngbya sp. BL0902 TaxID=1115757 RepID=UPI0018E8958E|nr:hypothetical protein [Leptolyngbya sp. BL0902]